MRTNTSTSGITVNKHSPPAPAIIPHPPPPYLSSYRLHPPLLCLVVCEGQLGGGESAHTASSLRQHPSSLSVRLSITVSLSLNVPNAQLHSHYLLITLDTTATGSTITKRAECKSATFVLTLFVDFFFPLGGGMLNVPLVIVVI